jgi:hypothetical protein
MKKTILTFGLISGAISSMMMVATVPVRKYKEIEDNPLLNAAMTFIEPFPIGLVMTLISAAVLRKKPQSQPAQSPLPAS